ncbi:hypothetical protein Pyn_08763 [Prunus yedoensis var. nudiflora]|uniref:Uncharacterized protein n=1 Tax=Prunus yedoensis var. nudiflora TaxID=2094558 RepID=A0A314ZB73_PRUYE|nr:hypothetical protein Pyn_08763 [Prunus yedoensis var. nudiflora]
MAVKSKAGRGGGRRSWAAPNGVDVSKGKEDQKIRNRIFHCYSSAAWPAVAPYMLTFIFMIYEITNWAPLKKLPMRSLIYRKKT